MSDLQLLNGNFFVKNYLWRELYLYVGQAIIKQFQHEMKNSDIQTGTQCTCPKNYF